MKNLLPYPKTEFQNTFSKTDIYRRLVEDFDIVSFEKCLISKSVSTPRQIAGHRNYKNVFSAVPFYYLQYLVEKHPKEMYDLGCGWNIFKKYMPNIIGVGAEAPDSGNYFGDIHDFVDDGYIEGHKEHFESVFSICALHFYPVELIANRINDFYSMIRPGGRGFLALNAQRMIDKGNKTFKSNFELDEFCRQELAKCKHINFIVIDIDLSFSIDDCMDGNIRLVMEK